MKHFKSGAELAKEMNISPAELKKTFDKYNEGAKTKKDEFEKVFFHNTPFVMDDEFHVAVVCPVVHYSMGGVQINDKAEIVRPSAENGKFGKAMKGLYAAGEVCGGVHGKNRLGGSGLLGCVVYGRVAGDSAAKELLAQLTESTVNRRVGGLMQQLAPGSFAITVNPGQNSFTIQLPGETGAAAPAASSAAAPAAAANAPAAAAAPAPVAKKEYTYEEVAKHNKETDCWCVVNGEVLDVTKFLDVHPGGRHAILLFAGKEVSTARHGRGHARGKRHSILAARVPIRVQPQVQDAARQPPRAAHEDAGPEWAVVAPERRLILACLAFSFGHDSP